MAVHSDLQAVDDLYPHCIILTLPDGTPVGLGQPWGMDLGAAKAARIAEATAVCNAVLSPLGVEYGRWETATWDQQYAEAVALMADPAASVPLIAALAQARGMDVAVLAQRIIRNRETWSVLTGSVIGQRLAIVDQINACATVADVLAVPMEIALPGAG
ncbi:hypothetical protein [Solidesulfovibrio sp.]